MPLRCILSKDTPLEHLAYNDSGRHVDGLDVMYSCLSENRRNAVFDRTD
jgi:hypothetical protein